MARIRSYEQSVGVGGEVGGRNATPEDFGYGRQMEQLGGAMQDTAMFLKKEDDRKQTEDAAVKVAQARQQWTETYLNRIDKADPGDMSVATNLRDEMNSYFTSMSENYSSHAAKKYVQMHGANTTNDFFARGLQHQQHQAGVKARVDFEVRLDAESKTVSAAPQLYDMVKGGLQFDAENGVGALGRLKNDPVIDKLILHANNTLAWAASMTAAKDPVLRSQIMSNVQVPQTAAVGKDNVITDIIKEEGGYVASDGNSKSPAKFGINQKYNPDVDVKNLTAEGAAQIYKDRYWNKIGGDNLSPAMATAAMTVAVMSGPETANQYIAQSGGDPMKVIEAHRSLLQRLAADPNRDDAKNLSGWMSRLDRLESKVKQTVSQDQTVSVVNEDGLPSYIKDLDPGARHQVFNTMRGYQKQEDGVARRALDQNINNDIAYMTLTGQAPQKRLTRVDFKDDQAGWDSYSATVTATEKLAGAWSVPFAEGKQMVESLRPSESEQRDPAFADKVKIYQQAQKLFATRSAKIAEDNIDADMNSNFAPGTGGMKPINVQVPDKWMSDIEIRVPQAKTSSESRNLPLRLFSDAEAKQMSVAFNAMPENKQMEFLTGIGDRFQNDPNVIRTLTQQIAQGKSGVAAVGNLMLSSPMAVQAGEKRDQTASYILFGTQLMNPPVGKDGKVEKGIYNQQMPTAQESLKAFNEISEYKKVSPEFTAALPQTMETIMAHYVGKLAKQGVTDFSVKDHASDFKASVAAVLGSPVSVGATKVIKPWGMSEDAFLEATRARVDAPWGTYGLRQPNDAPPNVYEVVQGNRIVGVVDVTRPLAPGYAYPPSTSQVPGSGKYSPSRPTAEQQSTGAVTDHPIYGDFYKNLGTLNSPATSMTYSDVTGR